MMSLWKPFVIMLMRHPVILPMSVGPTHLFGVPNGIGVFLPQDTISLLEEERGCDVEVPKGEKMDWSVVREKIAKHDAQQ